MRRLARWTLNVMTVLSALLCVATAGLWVRSRYCTDRWTPDPATWGQIIITSQGGAVYEQHYAWRTGSQFWVTSGFPEHLLPYFVPVIAFGLLPTMVGTALVVRRFRSSRPGQCLTCGYDLTGNVSGVCPECGTAVKGNA